MIDEMYLQIFALYQSGECVGVGEEGNLYKGIIAFTVELNCLQLSLFKPFQKSHLTDSG